MFVVLGQSPVGTLGRKILEKVEQNDVSSAPIAFVRVLTPIPAARLRCGPGGLLSTAQRVHGHGVRHSGDNHANDGAYRKCPSDPHGHLGRKSLNEKLLGRRGLGQLGYYGIVVGSPTLTAISTPSKEHRDQYRDAGGEGVSEQAKPCTDFGRTMMLPAPKLSLDGFELGRHSLLRGDPPDDESSVARALPTEVSETQEREGLRFSPSTPLPVSSALRGILRHFEFLVFPVRTVRWP